MTSLNARLVETAVGAEPPNQKPSTESSMHALFDETLTTRDKTGTRSSSTLELVAWRVFKVKMCETCYVTQGLE